MQGIPSGGKRRPLHSSLLLSICLVSLPLAAAEPSVERLTWAGIKVVEGDTTVFIDPVGTDLWNGEALGGWCRFISA